MDDSARQWTNVAVGAVFFVVLGCGGAENPTIERLEIVDAAAGLPTSTRVRCVDTNPLKSAYFGDLHVHTTLSSDAYNFDVRARPDDAYRYAFGEPIVLPPNDEYGVGTREVRIDRPLDFAAVTDHAEFLGEMKLCLDPDSAASKTEFCEAVANGTGREPALVKMIVSPLAARDAATCGSDGVDCWEAAVSGWQEIQRAAETWNDSTEACQRTAFIAYEYSSFRLGSNLHRNVIFRTSEVPNRPISFIEVSREWDLWKLLKEGCIDSGTSCDVLAIPHNSNISNGRMFAVDYPGAYSVDAQRERAELRAAIEPIVEVMQHKGDSECRPTIPGVIAPLDELCVFEKFENGSFRATTGSEPNDVGECYAGPLADWVPHMGPNCISKLSYTRYALTEGLKEEARLGVNPFKFGLMASTDTHNATPGAVEEKSYPGHLGKSDAAATTRTSSDTDLAGNTNNNPGGLIGVWSEENSRDALFEAMRRREVFGTSGPRIQPRFFGGFDLSPDACDDPEAVAIAYRDGVPMGGDLVGPAPVGAKPVFLAMANRDPGTAENPGSLLERIQVIKGWVDAEGQSHQAVFDVAGFSNGGGALVNLETCEPRGPGYHRLCGTFTDAGFDPDQRAVYYARVVENKSCRYSKWQCLELPEDERPAACGSPSVPKIIRERAWTSPIWYTP